MHQSRFGYHPCDKETYLKLKLLHKYYWQTVKDFADWKRWERKEPQNRVIRRWRRDSTGKKCGSEVVGPRPEPLVCPYFLTGGSVSDRGILHDYRLARWPQANPEDVGLLKMSLHKIDQLLEDIEGWYADRKQQVA